MTKWTAKHQTQRVAWWFIALIGALAFGCDQESEAPGASCGIDGQTYTDGTRWPSDCNTCRCDDGVVSCTTEVCAPTDMGMQVDMATPEDMGLDPNECDPACEAPTAVCDEGVCVECATNANCDVDLICDPATKTCVGCLANADCTDGVCKTDENRCVQCNEVSDCGVGQCFENQCVECYQNNHCGQQRCLVDSVDATNNACVDCLELDDCTDPAASRCGASNTCEACVDNTDCADISDYCVDGFCGECTVATETTDCNGKSCDPATHMCTMTDVGSVNGCESCVADSECPVGYRCVPMTFQVTEDLGGFCLRILATGCPEPYRYVISSESLSGAALDDYCGIYMVQTTCTAVLDFRKSCMLDSDCGIDGLADGKCLTVTGLGRRCTYTCAVNNQCPNGYSCNSTTNYCE